MEYIEVTKKEMEILNLINLKMLSIKKCSKEVDLTVEEVEKLIINLRKKLTIAIIENIPVKLIEEPQKIESLCKFRCFVCGSVYDVNYKNDKIICPLCFSNKVMDNKESGFFN